MNETLIFKGKTREVELVKITGQETKSENCIFIEGKSEEYF